MQLPLLKNGSSACVGSSTAQPASDEQTIAKAETAKMRAKLFCAPDRDKLVNCDFIAISEIP